MRSGNDKINNMSVFSLVIEPFASSFVEIISNTRLLLLERRHVLMKLSSDFLRTTWTRHKALTGIIKHRNYF